MRWRSAIGFTLLAVACDGAADAGGPRPPNLVLLISDDQDPTHLGFTGHTGDPTPALDRLAARGAVFSRGVTEPVCRPALAGLLSGRHPHQTGICVNRSTSLLRGPDLLPELLRRRGYLTYADGKFWEGNPREVGFTHGPDRQEDWSGLSAKTFVRSDQAQLFAFLEQAGDRPFFVWWAPMLPHLPHDPSDELLERFPLETIEIPAWIAPGDENAFREAEAKSLAMTARLDLGVEELVRKLRELGQLERTLFVFVIDNGWANGLPAKGTPFEKGVRTPILVAGPGVPAGAGDDRLVSYLDVMPTLLDYAGVDVPAGCEGRSLRPAIEGTAGEPREALFGAAYGREVGPAGRPEEDVRALWMRDERWKYLFWARATTVGPEGELGVLRAFTAATVRTEGQEELYDLSLDPWERNDLSQDPAQRERMSRMRRQLVDWWERTGGRPLAPLSG